MTNKRFFHYTKQQEHCPQCGGILQIKQSKKGAFLGCTNYPQCNYLRPLQHIEWKILKELNENCPLCHSILQLKQGHFGLFIGCSRYPECHFIVQDEQPSTTEEIECPDCHKGRLIARRGRQGRTFYGCERFPHCKFSLSKCPYSRKCPQCGFTVSILKQETESVQCFQCANKRCRHQFERQK
ncbi:type I DNA topoisomerase [Rodentibacter caecimuris]|uniref:DNA topoisomerase type IA zn finger domain-containing protein n=1 Tax=Rodentibacter caecimuris TaxID=1796644 RepID=A0ABX3L0E8_9PAST|nr:hypothetical protein BKG89_00420 [Rodentibacter heylii]